MTELPRNPNSYRLQEAERLRRENAELQAQLGTLRKFVESLNEIYEVSDEFRYNSQLYPFLRNTLNQAMRLLDSPDGSLALIDEETNELVFVIVIGELAQDMVDTRLPLHEGIAGWVCRNAEPTLVRNVRNDPRFYEGIDEQFRFQTRSIAAAPLIGDRKVYGLIEVLNQPNEEPFSEEDLTILKLLCRVAGEALAYIDSMPQDDDEAAESNSDTADDATDNGEA